MRHCYNIVHMFSGSGFIVPDRLFCFKQPGAGRDADGLQGRGDCQTDRFICPGFIRNEQIRCQRILFHFHTLHRGIEALQINANICPYVQFLTSRSILFRTLPPSGYVRRIVSLTEIQNIQSILKIPVNRCLDFLFVGDAKFIQDPENLRPAEFAYIIVIF